MRDIISKSIHKAEIKQKHPLIFKFLLAVVLTASAGNVFSQTSDKNAIRFANTITVEDSRKHLQVLASDEYGGRETGKEGQRKAAAYLAEHFKKYGLKPSYGEGYYQNVPMTESTPAASKLEVGGKKYEDMKDFYVMPLDKEVKLEGKEMLFLGYGISENFEKNEKPEGAIAYDDYAGKDVKGKLLVILGGEPRGEDSVCFLSGKKEPSKWSTSFRKKISLARSKGAAGLLVISSNFEATLEMMKEHRQEASLDLEPKPSSKKEEEEKPVPQAVLSVKAGNELLANQKTNFEDIKKQTRLSKKPVSFELKLPYLLDVTINTEKIKSENVLGIVEGSDLKDEVLFITAHYDHLGIKDGKVYNGADDDGSGTVAVMEMAEAFAKAKEAGAGPRRTIVFMAVTGEEKGLLGSKYYTETPLYPIANTVCNLNIDMIGRADEAHKDDSSFVYIIGSDKISTDLHKINENANSTYIKLKLDYKYNDKDDPNRFYYRSDHYNFAEKGVPIIFYFNGVHEDYHEETDEISKINFPLMVKRTRLVFHTAWDVANRDKRIVSDVKQEEKK